MFIEHLLYTRHFNLCNLNISAKQPLADMFLQSRKIKFRILNIQGIIGIKC